MRPNIHVNPTAHKLRLWVASEATVRPGASPSPGPRSPVTALWRRSSTTSFRAALAFPTSSTSCWTTSGPGSSAGAREYVSIEVKHMSAVTDQFKCRAFDMLHMKQAFGPSYTASWFLREPFDDFVGIDLLKADSSTLWQPVLDKVDAILTRP